MNQTERIEQMERCLDRAETAVKTAEAALEQLEAVKDDVRRLADYYGSALWRKDFEDDAKEFSDNVAWGGSGKCPTWCRIRVEVVPPGSTTGLEVRSRGGG